MMNPQNLLESAAFAIQQAESLLFTAGAGIGVDSGLPDFRGDDGFWQAYPPFRELGLSFSDLANPGWFERDPHLAWGFYGHRLGLYRQTIPHAGFAILKKWSEQKPAHVYTSNVDGQFQRAGLDDVCEVHGSILHAQCTQPCCDAIWSLENTAIEVDATSFRAAEPLPRCPNCGAMARPNILMFNDGAWIEDRSEAQKDALQEWLKTVEISRLVIIEIGAGTAIPSVRRFGERLQAQGASLIRINVRESQGPSGTVSLSMGGREALAQLDAIMR